MDLANKIKLQATLLEELDLVLMVKHHELRCVGDQMNIKCKQDAQEALLDYDGPIILSLSSVFNLHLYLTNINTLESVCHWVAQNLSIKRTEGLKESLKML